MKGIIYSNGKKRQCLNGCGKENSDKQQATALVRHSQHKGCCGGFMCQSCCTGSGESPTALHKRSKSPCDLSPLQR